MRSLSRQSIRRRPHSHQSCEATDRNSIQGPCGSASEPTITKPSSFVYIGKSRACAAKVERLTQGGLQPTSGSRPCAKAGAELCKQFGGCSSQQRPSYCFVARHRRQEGPNREEQGGATNALGSRKLLRPESTDPARIDQPALSVSLRDSGAELAPLRGTAWCGPACQVVWGPGRATVPATRFRHRFSARPPNIGAAGSLLLPLEMIKDLIKIEFHVGTKLMSNSFDFSCWIRNHRLPPVIVLACKLSAVRGPRRDKPLQSSVGSAD